MSKLSDKLAAVIHRLGVNRFDASILASALLTVAGLCAVIIVFSAFCAFCGAEVERRIKTPRSDVNRLISEQPVTPARGLKIATSIHVCTISN